MKKKYTCKFCNHESGCQYAHEQHLKTHEDQAIHCELCDTLLWDLKGLMMHVARCHKDYTKEKYWDDFIYKSKICPLSKDTNKPLNYFQYTKQHGYEIRSNLYHSTKPTESNYICQICGVGFAEVNHLAKHLTDSHPNIDNEKYYLEHIWKDGDPDGKCLECGKQLKFLNFKKGYQKFCYNTDCNVNYYNKHKNRHQCGETISQGQKRTQNMPNQIGFWVKKGYTEEQARALVTERQTTNSLEKILQREKCSLTEAKKIRKQITEKWLKSLPRQNYSKKSQDLFWEIYEQIKDKYGDVYFATNQNGKHQTTKNKEYRVQTKTTYRMLDFFIPSINKVIEFDGVYWHGERGRGNKTSDEMRDKEIIESINAKILHINENEYDKDKEATIQKCLEFLNNE